MASPGAPASTEMLPRRSCREPNELLQCSVQLEWFGREASTRPAARGAFAAHRIPEHLRCRAGRLPFQQIFDAHPCVRHRFQWRRSLAIGGWFGSPARLVAPGALASADVVLCGSHRGPHGKQFSVQLEGFSSEVSARPTARESLASLRVPERRRWEMRLPFQQLFDASP